MTQVQQELSQPTLSAIKMDELLVGWLGRDDVYDNVLQWIDKFKAEQSMTTTTTTAAVEEGLLQSSSSPALSLGMTTTPSQQQKQQQQQLPPPPRNVESPQTVLIPPFYPLQTPSGTKLQRRRSLSRPFETWETLPDSLQLPQLSNTTTTTTTTKGTLSTSTPATVSMEDTPDDELQQDQQHHHHPHPHHPFPPKGSVKDQFFSIVDAMGFDPFSLSTTNNNNNNGNPNNNNNPNQNMETPIPIQAFVRVTKEICHFPTFFNGCLYQRILDLWNLAHTADTSSSGSALVVTGTIFEWFWKTEMEPYDAEERLFRLIKQPQENCILREDLLPYIKALLNEHPVRNYPKNPIGFDEFIPWYTQPCVSRTLFLTRRISFVGL